MANNEPTGTSTPTELARLGTQRNSTTMKSSGARAIFQSLDTYTTAKQRGQNVGKRRRQHGAFQNGAQGIEHKHAQDDDDRRYDRADRNGDGG